MTGSAATIQVSSFDSPLSGNALAQIEALLPDYLARQRWYRSKARAMTNVKVADVVLFGGAFVLVLTIDYADGGTDTYQLPVELRDEDSSGSSDVVVRVQNASGSERVLTNALSSSGFRARLLEALTAGERFTGEHGALTASRSSALRRQNGDAIPESFVSRAEQSNSSVIYGDQYILKVFRKVESGVNPDLEIGRYLTEHRFKYTPPVLGEIVYQPAQGETMHAAILQGFVKNQGDAWKFTLDSLPGFFGRAFQAGIPPVLSSNHPLELAAQELSAQERQIVGEYIESARLLGTRTAQMHAALSTETSDPDFKPEPFTPEYAGHLYNEMIDQAESTFALLDDKQHMLSGEAAGAAKMLLGLRESVRAHFGSLRSGAIQAVRIRHHGDYHLGQVLATGNDFVIIDFEGEPARPLAHRRIKTLAMRDVAGMLRSFSYAGYSALFGLVPDVKVTEENRNQVEGWAAYWGGWVSAEYLKGYFAASAGESFVGRNQEEHRLLFDAFVLQKALYEVSYELNNRPDWVQIPLHGILTLIA